MQGIIAVNEHADIKYQVSNSDCELFTKTNTNIRERTFNWSIFKPIQVIAPVLYSM